MASGRILELLSHLFQQRDCALCFSTIISIVFIIFIFIIITIKKQRKKDDEEDEAGSRTRSAEADLAGSPGTCTRGSCVRRPRLRRPVRMLLDRQGQESVILLVTLPGAAGRGKGH